MIILDELTLLELNIFEQECASMGIPLSAQDAAVVRAYRWKRRDKCISLEALLLIDESEMKETAYNCDLMPLYDLRGLRRDIEEGSVIVGSMALGQLRTYIAFREGEVDRLETCLDLTGVIEMKSSVCVTNDRHEGIRWEALWDEMGIDEELRAKVVEQHGKHGYQAVFRAYGEEYQRKHKKGFKPWTGLSD